MDQLGDYPRGMVQIDCQACRRIGRYDAARLQTLYGLDITVLDLLRALSATCRHQQPVGAGPQRKYLVRCQARILMPAKPLPDLPTPGGMTYTVETWYRSGGNIELHLGTLYRLDMADAAFRVVCALWPDTPATVRQGARILLKHKLDD